MSAEQWANYISSQVMSSLPLATGQINMNGNVGWHTIYFNVPFKTIPKIFVQGHAKFGLPKFEGVQLPEVKLPLIQIPEIEYPIVELPEIQINPLQIPKIQLPELDVDLKIPNWKEFIPDDDQGNARNLQTYMYDEAFAMFRESTSGFDWFPANAIRDGLLWPTASLIGWVGSIISWVIDIIIWPNIDKIQFVLNDIKKVVNYDIIGRGYYVTRTERVLVDPTARGRDRFETRTVEEWVEPNEFSINHALSQMIDAMNEIIKGIALAIEGVYSDIKLGIEDISGKVRVGLQEAGKNVNIAFEETTAHINEFGNDVRRALESALNEGINRLYEHMGAINPDGTPNVQLPIVSTVTRNVGLNSFEFYSTGGSYSWVAVGAKVGGSDVIGLVDQGIKTLQAHSPVPF